MPLAQLTGLKSTQKNCADMCNRCAKNGLHIYSTQSNRGPLESHAVNRIIDFQRRTIMGLPVESEKLGRTGEVSAENFDEAQYLQMNQDVKNAISTGAFTSGYQHYVLFGRLEGRLGAGYLTVV
jgi:hypothetical protein